MTLIQLLLAASLIVANGFFVAVEFALVAAPRSPLQRLADQGNRRAKLALASTGDLGRQLAGAQLGITVTSLALGLIAESALSEIIQDAVGGLGGAISHGLAAAIALGLGVLSQMLLGEMVPKNAAVATPVKMAMLIAPPHRLFVLVFMPVISLINWLGNRGVRLLGVTPTSEVDESRTPAELASMLERSRRQGIINEFDHALLAGALDFGEQTVAKHMVSRDSIVALPKGSSVEDAERLVVSSGHSRLPIYTHSMGDSVSFIHAKDLLRVPESQRGEAIPSDMVRRLWSVTGDELLENTLVWMRRERQHLALVRTVNGAVVGLISLEDVLESLVGEIEDESDEIS